MSTRFRAVVSLFLFMLTVPGIAFAERRGKLIGRIVDPEGKPLAGVVVTATSPDIPNFRDMETTDKKGIFEIDFQRIDVTYHYRFDKLGYETLEADQHWSLEGSQLYSWTLQPATAVQPTAGQRVPTQPVAPASKSAPAIEAFNSGLAAMKASDNATAETKFKEAVVNDPNLRQAWEALAVIEVELGKYADAASSAEKAMALGSTDEPVLTARWQAYRNLHNDAMAAEALKDLEKIGRRTEESKKAYNEAVALSKTGDNAGAYAKFQEALSIDPNLQVALLGIADTGVKLGKNAEAAAAAETILKSDPKNEAAIRVRYNACLALGDKARLIDALIALAPYEPVHARDGLLRLAFEAYDANDNATAKARFEKVLEVDPDYPLAHYYLGVLGAASGASAEAKKHLERFLELAPKDAEAKSAREMLKYLK